MELLRERTLLWQWGDIDGAPAGADTAAAVWKYGKGSCGSGHCLRPWGNIDSAPAGADTAAAVGKLQVALLGEQSLLR